MALISYHGLKGMRVDCIVSRFGRPRREASKTLVLSRDSFPSRRRNIFFAIIRADSLANRRGRATKVSVIYSRGFGVAISSSSPGNRWTYFDGEVKRPRILLVTLRPCTTWSQAGSPCSSRVGMLFPNMVCQSDQQKYDGGQSSATEANALVLSALR